jgi:hypothetical protein
MKKETAIEWLFAHLLPFLEFSDPKEREHFRKCLSEAKAMEKEQIVNAFKEGLRSPYHQDYTIVTQEGQEGTKSGQYYNENYGGDK